MPLYRPAMHLTTGISISLPPRIENTYKKHYVKPCQIWDMTFIMNTNNDITRPQIYIKHRHICVSKPGVQYLVLYTSHHTIHKHTERRSLTKIQKLVGSDKAWHHISTISNSHSFKFSSHVLRKMISLLHCRPSKCYRYRHSDVIVSRKILPRISLSEESFIHW